MTFTVSVRNGRSIVVVSLEDDATFRDLTELVQTAVQESYGRTEPIEIGYSAAEWAPAGLDAPVLRERVLVWRERGGTAAYETYPVDMEDEEDGE